MKCNNCGFENKDTAKFCTRCGKPVDAPKEESENNSKFKIIILCLIGIIVILALSFGFMLYNNGIASSPSNGQADSASPTSYESQQSTSSSSAQQSKDWVLIGSYSGSGSGSQSVSIPAGQIRIKLSAFPIKNYATNHLYVRGSNGESAGVDWGSNSAVATRSDSLTYTSSSPQTFTIDYYETVSWQVDIYMYK